MPRSLPGRIALAFIGLSLAIWLALGGTLFLVLRGLHGEATIARLTDVAVPLVAQVRLSLANGTDVRTALSALLGEMTDTDLRVYLALADGRIAGLGAGAVTLDGLRLDPALARGGIDSGLARAPDGSTWAWVATILRNPRARGPRAVIVAAPDRSGTEALRDLLGALPGVILVTLLVGAPVAWLLSRSVTAPLRRLAAATADLPMAAAAGATRVEPLPLEGPAEVRELTERFEAMRAELSTTRRREAELLANLRHDLRTPLTVISGFAQALGDGTARGVQAARAAEAIAQEAARIEALVDELGAIERLGAGGEGLRPEPIELGELLQGVVERFRPAARARGIELEVVGGDEPPPLTADRLAVERILANLVSNAMAALGPGPGHVWLEARSLPAGAAAGGGPGTAAGGRVGATVPSGGGATTSGRSGSVVISVTDDGPGFPPGSLDRVFDRFYRADPARSGPGSGLGLAIVRELARAHGGSVHAENVAPRGARVSVVLPAVARPVPG
ncbi:MAG: HAMP domain-containing sensor histidine kinase [Chloroflexota bacterium]